MTPSNLHLPMSKAEMHQRGWSELDVLLVTGDAYFDHPSHGVAVIGRVLESAGYRVGIIARPNWYDQSAFKVLGRPRLFAGVSAGAVDSLLNNYTAHKKRRREDAYAPEGDTTGRPNMATLVYANNLKAAFPNLPVILGGVEASTRRFAYYDYVKNKMRRSLLVDARADLLVYGHGEQQVLNIAHRLENKKDLGNIPGTARLVLPKQQTQISTEYQLPSYAEILANADNLLIQTQLVEQLARPGFKGTITQQYKEGTVICEAPIQTSSKQLDAIFALPFTRTSHPRYKTPIKAMDMIRWSVISHRGCPGGCSFCALAFHQGRLVVSRSKASILSEIKNITKQEQFKGIISDIGGPTANAYSAVPKKTVFCQKCKRPSCLFPKICPNINTDQSDTLDLFLKAAQIPGVKKVFIASGIRHDLALKHPPFVAQIAALHTGGHLKVAPEHTDKNILNLMRKPPIALFEQFEKQFLSASQQAGLEQYLVPYFIAGFPGAALEQAKSIENWLLKRGQKLRQVQTFIPLPGTMAAAVYVAGKNENLQPVYIPNTAEQLKQKQMLTCPKVKHPNTQKNKKQTPFNRLRSRTKSGLQRPRKKGKPKY